MLIPFGVFSAAGAGGGASAGSFDLISTTLLASSAASVTFDVTGLGSTYKHLQIRSSAKISDAVADLDNMLARFNGDSGSNYSHHRLWGSGSSVASYNGVSQTYTFSGLTPRGTDTNVYSANVLDILDAFNTSKNKTTRLLAGAHHTSQQAIELASGAWYSTSAITSIVLSPGDPAKTFNAKSRFSIYGIRG